MVVDAGKEESPFMNRSVGNVVAREAFDVAVPVEDAGGWLNVVSGEEAAPGRDSAEIAQARAPLNAGIQALTTKGHVGRQRHHVGVWLQSDLLACAQARRVLELERQRRRCLGRIDPAGAGARHTIERLVQAPRELCILYGEGQGTRLRCG